MAQLTAPDENLIDRVNDEVAVGSDPEFQRKWWRFEKVVWVFFLLVVLAALFGLLGRGFLARATVAARDGSMRVQYDRIARYSTPSVLRVEFGGAAVHDGRVQLWVSDDLLKSLGNQRVTPEPTASVLDSGGVLYTFPVLTSPAAVQFALQPLRAGIQHVTLRVPGSSSLGLSVTVWP